MTRAYQVLDGVELYKYRPYAPGGSKLSFVAEYAYSLPRDGLADAQGTAVRPVRRAAGLQPARHLLADRPGPSRRRPHPVRVRPPRPVPRALRVPVPGRPEAALPGAAGPGAQDAPDRGPRDLHQRLLPGDRHHAERQVDQPTSPSCAPARTRSGCERGPAYPELRRGRRFLAAYIGVMGPQDGVDIVVRAADIVVHKLGRDDIAFTLIGSGDCFDDLVALRDELGLADHVEFTGRVPDEFVTRILSTADVGLSPDPKNPLNDVSTMNKTMEYMAFELPVVAFDLRETRVSRGDAGVYVTPNDVVRVCGGDRRSSWTTSPSAPGWGSWGVSASSRSWPGATRSAPTSASTGGSWAMTASRASGPGAEVCGIAGCYQQADGQKLVDIMTDRIAHRGPDAAGILEPRGRPRGGAARPPAAVDHRPQRRGRPAAVQARPDARLQRRAVQLPGAAGRAGRPRRPFRHRIRHRGRARGLAMLGTGGAAPVPRHVRVRAARRAHRRSRPGA